MKFLARLDNSDSIEKFSKVLSTVGKLSKTCVMRVTDNKLIFTQNANLRENVHKMWCELVASHLFSDFRFEGFDKHEANEILLNLNPEEFNRAIKSSATDPTRQAQIALSKKDKIIFLTVQIKVVCDNGSRTITHDVPVSNVPPQMWRDYAEPLAPDFDVSITVSNSHLGNTKNLLKITNIMRNWTDRLELAANFDGDFRLTIETDSVKISTHFRDLIYPQWDEQSQQIPAADKYKFITTNVDTKAFLQFISAIQTISSAEVVCSIQQDRIAHMYVSEESDFVLQVFLPAILV